MYRRILLPLDGSQHAEAALPVAIAIAERARNVGELVLVRVTPDLWIGDAVTSTQLDSFGRELERDCKTYLERVAIGLRERGLRVQTRVLSGVVADEIVALAATTRSNMIVMSSHGLSGVKRAMLGSVTDKVLHYAGVPVMLVRPAESLLDSHYDPKFSPWQIKREDMPHADRNAQLRYLLRYAILAPSTHNTQPWKFAVTADTIDLYVDQTRWLHIADADQRELYISAGCALENLLVAAEHFGFEHAVTLMPDDAAKSLAARVTLTPGSEKTPLRTGLFDCIPGRFTNHNPYDGFPVSPSLLAKLHAVWSEADVDIALHADLEVRQAVDSLIARADAVQFADPAFREELGRSIGNGAFGTPWLFAKLEQMAVTVINLGKTTAKHDSQLLKSAPVFGVVTTTHDDRKSQIRAGQAYERMHLLATRLGLSVQPMNQLLQLQYFKSALKDTLFPERRIHSETGVEHPAQSTPTPQIAFRLGFGERSDEHTPRAGP